MKVAIVGTGYVGLVAGACFADTGNEVLCVDKDPQKIAALERGQIPIYEPGLDAVVKRAAAQGNLRFTGDIAQAVQHAQVIFMAVGTPALPSGESDLSFLKAASEDVGRAMTRFKTGHRVVVNKSTVPVGSRDVVGDWIRSCTDQPFDVASNPEFLKEGAAVEDFMKPDRVVIGTDKKEVYDILAELYAPFVRQGNPIYWMDPVSAEITKYACNSFLATRISFMNEVAALCDKVGADIELVRKGMASDPRIGKHFLYAGAGYGGSCFPKDIEALLNTGRKLEVPLSIVAAAKSANDRQKKHLVSLVKNHYGASNLAGKTFALWGLAFKPNTDDVREAPALVVAEELLRAGAKVKAFDPVAVETTRKVMGDRIEYSANMYSAAEAADGLIVVTEWNEFRTPDFERIKKALRQAVVFDGRNLYTPEKMKSLGFKYYGIGRRA